MWMCVWVWVCLRHRWLLAGVKRKTNGNRNTKAIVVDLRNSNEIRILRRANHKIEFNCLNGSCVLVLFERFANFKQIHQHFFICLHCFGEPRQPAMEICFQSFATRLIIISFSLFVSSAIVDCVSRVIQWIKNELQRDAKRNKCACDWVEENRNQNKNRNQSEKRENMRITVVSIGYYKQILWWKCEQLDR